MKNDPMQIDMFEPTPTALMPTAAQLKDPLPQAVPAAATPIEDPKIPPASQVPPKTITDAPSTPQETATVGTKPAEPGEEIEPVSSAAKTKVGGGQKTAGKATQKPAAMNDIKSRNRGYTAARRKKLENGGFARLDVPIDAAVLSACRDYVGSPKPGGMSVFVTEVIVRALKKRGVNLPSVVASVGARKKRPVGVK